jgi:hypothetical protein
VKTVVVQAWAGDRPRFIDSCLGTVRDWAALQGFDYRFETDALLADVPESYRRRVSNLVLPMAVFGRLLLLRQVLRSGCDRVIWCDADVVIFDPADLHMRGTGDYALTYEVWTETDPAGRVRHAPNITGCFMMFERENPFLDFALHALAQRAERTPITEPRASFTYMLTELGEVVPLRTVREVGMVSPLLMGEIARATPRHLAGYMETVGVPLCGVNLCTAFHNLVYEGVHMTDAIYERVIERCLTTGGEVFNRHLPPRVRGSTIPAAAPLRGVAPSGRGSGGR